MTCRGPKPSHFGSGSADTAGGVGSLDFNSGYSLDEELMRLLSYEIRVSGLRAYHVILRKKGQVRARLGAVPEPTLL
jgi:hypothetical protein